MALPVVVRGAANDLAVQLSTTGYGLPLELSTLTGALPVRVVTTGGVSCLDVAGTVFGVSLTAPVLAFVSATDPDSDNTQDYLVTLTSPVAGDKIYTNAKIGGFSIPNDPTEFDVQDIHTLTAPEIIALEAPVSLTLSPDGSWSNRAFHWRGGSFSNASNVKTKTIATMANTVAPSIAGTEVQGYTLTVTPGTWTGSPALTYQWQAGGVDIGGQTATTYVITAADEDARAVITCKEIPNATPASGVSSNSKTIFNPIDLFSGGKKGVILDPTRIGKLWKDIAGTSAVTADADLVARIDDRSPNAWNVLQSLSGNRPEYNTTIHAQGALLFASASSDWMDLTASAASIFQAAAYGTIIAFAKQVSTGAQQTIFIASSGTGAGSSRLVLDIDTTNHVRVVTRRLDADAGQIKASTATIDGVDHVFTAEADWANTVHKIAIDLNAAETAVPTWGAGAATSNTASLGVGVGGSTLVGNLLTADLGRLIAINVELSAGNKALAQKWCGKGGGMSL